MADAEAEYTPTQWNETVYRLGKFHANTYK